MFKFADPETRARNLAQLIEAQMALDAGHNQPTEVPTPRQPVRPQPAPKVDLEQFAHLAEAVCQLGTSADLGAKVVISAAKVRGDIPAKPPTAIAQAFIDAANKARKPAADPDLPTDPTARAIVLAARKAVNPHHPVRR